MIPYFTSLLWRQSYPQVLPALILIGTLLAVCPGCFAIGLTILLLVIGSLLSEWIARGWATLYGYRARFWVPSPRSWISQQLRRQGYSEYQELLAQKIWEVHAQDQRRWIANTPKDAADLYRRQYIHEFARLIANRPKNVSLLCTTFNRLTAEEQAIIQNAGGIWWHGPLTLAIPRAFSPKTMKRMHRRMFGAVVSQTIRNQPERWTTWIVPAIDRGSLK